VTETFDYGEELVPTITKEWERQAMERCPAKGIGQGEARLLRQLLCCRFGALPEWVDGHFAAAEIAAAETTRLEAWAKRVLDAPRLKAVFAGAS